MSEFGDMQPGPGLPEALLSPEAMWAIVWTATCMRLQETRRRRFATEYCGRLFEAIRGIQAAADVLRDELPDNEAPKASLWSVMLGAQEEMATRHGRVDADMLTSLEDSYRVRSALVAHAAVMATNRCIGQAYAAWQAGEIPSQLIAGDE